MAVRGFGGDVSDWWFRVRPLGFVFFGVWVFRCFRLAVRGRGFELEVRGFVFGRSEFSGFQVKGSGFSWLGVLGFRVGVRGFAFEV